MPNTLKKCELSNGGRISSKAIRGQKWSEWQIVVEVVFEDVEKSRRFCDSDGENVPRTFEDAKTSSTWWSR
jgi:hypothetical protein